MRTFKFLAKWTLYGAFNVIVIDFLFSLLNIPNTLVFLTGMLGFGVLAGLNTVFWEREIRNHNKKVLTKVTESDSVISNDSNSHSCYSTTAFGSIGPKSKRNSTI